MPTRRVSGGEGERTMNNEKEIAKLRDEIRRMRTVNAIMNASLPILRFLLWCAETVVNISRKLENLIYEFPEEE